MAGEPKGARPGDEAAVRLELIKLVHRHDLTPDQLIERAEKFEGFVRGKFQPPSPSP